MKNGGTVIVLGTFDGVHIGHRALIDRAVSMARSQGKHCIIYTFSNHPLSLISHSPKLLMTGAERIAELESMGADLVAADTFDKTLADTSPLDFLVMLKNRFGMTDAVAGYNYSFGKGGKGNVETLTETGSTLGFSAYIASPVRYKGESVSSSRIRACIENGNISDANAMLKRNFSLSGKVVLNKRVGRKIGFPTANIEVDPCKVLPRNGVYATNSFIFGKRYNSVTNIGTNPTVNGNKLSIETYIIDFDDDIYGKELKISFIDRIRDDKKFDSLAELQVQIAKDTEYFAPQLETYFCE